MDVTLVKGFKKNNLFQDEVPIIIFPDNNVIIEESSEANRIYDSKMLIGNFNENQIFIEESNLIIIL